MIFVQCKRLWFSSLGILLLLSSSSLGQTWLGGFSDSQTNTPEWNIGTNWSPTGAPTNTQTATFGNTSNTLVTFFNTGNVAGNLSITGSTAYTFGSTTNAFGSGQDPGSLTLGNGATASSLTSGSSANQSVVANIAFASGTGSRTVQNNSSGSITFDRLVTSASTNATAGLSVVNNGSGNILFNGGVSAAGGIRVSGTGSGSVRFGNEAGDSFSAVTVSGTGATGTRLHGIGVIGGALTVSTGGSESAIYSPGLGANVIGLQTIGSTLAAGSTALTVNNGATFEFDLGAATAGGPAGTSDVISLSSRGLDLAGTGLGITVRANLLNNLTGLDVASPVKWDIFTNVSNAGSIDLSKLTVDFVAGASINGASAETTNFFWTSSGSTLTLNAVPEPSSMALVGLVGVGAAGFARRRMKKDAKKESV